MQHPKRVREIKGQAIYRSVSQGKTFNFRGKALLMPSHF